MCLDLLESLSPLKLLEYGSVNQVYRAVLRIMTELERCPPEKVCFVYNNNTISKPFIARLVLGPDNGIMHTTA